MCGLCLFKYRCAPLSMFDVLHRLHAVTPTHLSTDLRRDGHVMCHLNTVVCSSVVLDDTVYRIHRIL